MSLPASCEGCPLAGQGQRYVADQVRDSAPVLVLRDGPGDGSERYAKLAGMVPEAVSVASAIRCTATLPPMAALRKGQPGKPGIAEEAIRFCHNAHFQLGEGTKLVIARGELALWAVSGLRSSTSWRGWIVPRRGLGNGWQAEVWTPSLKDVPVLVHAPTADPLAQRYDWRKVKRVLEGSWPVPFPGYEVEPPKVWPKASAFDTEFDPVTKTLTRFSLFDGQQRPWVVEAADVRRVALPEGVTPTVFMHNVEADILHLERMLGDQVYRFHIEDTLLMDSVLWSDRPHDLEYLASLYGRLNRSKHLSYESVVYSAADAIITWDVAMALVREMREDPQSYREYRDSVYPLTSIIMEAEREGLRLDQARLEVALRHHQGLQEVVTGQAQAYTGYPINLGSPEQVQRWLYKVEKIKMKRGG